MKRTILYWIIAFIITIASAIYQRTTGPTYPISGKIELNGKEIPYKLKRSDETIANHRVLIKTNDPLVKGYVEWKRHKTTDNWTRVDMIYQDDTLSAEIPVQPPAGKLQYRVYLQDLQKSSILPNEGPAIIRYKGPVPTVFLILHVILIFSAMLFSTRTGMETFSPQPKFNPLIYWTVGLLLTGGLIFGAILQKYAFGAFWTGWPFGTDLTDNKTAIAFISWILALIAVKKSPNPKKWILSASIITLIIFLIPHSLLGSELDYSKIK